MNKLTLNTSVSDLYMVGEKYAQRLKKINIQTVEDFLFHFPSKHKDLSLISQISKLQAGEKTTVQGTIVNCRNIYTKHGKKIQKAIIKDDSGQIEAVWFNQPYLTKTLKTNTKISLSGEVNYFGGKLNFTSPEYEILKKDSATIHTARIVPVYPETYGVSSKWLRSRIAPLLNKMTSLVDDWLPLSIKRKHNLINLKKALQQIHFPLNQKQLAQAKNRLAFNELFLIQLKALLRKKDWQKNKPAQVFKINTNKIKKFIKTFPFEFTNAQSRVVEEIIKDLQKKKPMNRLLEGDVGSGKTVVAAVAIYTAFLNKTQSALMAPTEILAKQHFQTLKEIFKPFPFRISLLTSSSQQTNTNRESPDAKHHLYIGTHALIYDKLQPEKLGLVVIDEQHRFGVKQRAKLINKGKAPHVLTMTATPIPRTISLTIYGDLDLSILDEMPKGRKKIKTWVVPQHKRKKAYQWVKKQIKKNNTQTFVVCPLIEESDKESMKDIKAASAEFERLQKVFSPLKLGLLHGRLKNKQKEKVIKDFQKNKTSILVSTPVVEVGIDIPNATIMLIEASERFGLAQLHQLRGRVGRAEQQSYCLLFTSKKTNQKLKRLQALQKYNSGFKLAEIDLKLRGPGQIYGTQQHGFIDLKIADFSDIDLINKTKKSAKTIINNLEKHSSLKKRLKRYRIKSVKPN